MTKAALLVLWVSFLMISSLWAAPAISLQVSQSKKTAKEKNSWGDTDRTQTQALNIAVRNLSPKTEEFTVQWLFIAKSQQNGKLWTYSYNSSNLALKSGQATNFVATSEELVAKSYDVYFGSHSKPYAFAVVAFQETNIFKCVASTQPVQAKCSKWDGFAEMLDSEPPEDK